MNGFALQNTTIVPGSLSAIAQASGQSLAETFVHCDAVVIVDTSGSMSYMDSLGGRSRYDVALDELTNLQAKLPGRIGVIAFSDQVQFCPGGQPVYFGGGTKLDRALDFARVADVDGIQFVVISDGQPDDKEKALSAAKTYRHRIDVVYVGPEGGSGQQFLAQLAQASGGKAVTAAQSVQLEAKVREILALPGD